MPQEREYSDSTEVALYSLRGTGDFEWRNCLFRKRAVVFVLRVQGTPEMGADLAL